MFHIFLRIFVFGQLFSSLDFMGLFPYQKFVNKSDFIDSFRFYRYSCSFLQHPKPNRCCDCHEDCMRHRTCCIDYGWNIENSNLEEHIKTFLNETKKYKPVTCEKLLPNVNHKTQSLLMIKTCKSFTKKYDVVGCLGTKSDNIELESVFPVFGSDNNLYRNKFCARCNFVNDYTHLDIEGKCENASSLLNVNKVASSTLNQLTKCEFSYIQKGSIGSPNIRECIDTNLCPKDHKFYDLCNAYSGVMSDGFNIYKNYHCYKCMQPQPIITQSVNISLPFPPISKDCDTKDNICTRQHCYLPNGREESKLLASFKLTNVNSTIKVTDLKHKFPSRQFFDISDSYTFDTNKGMEQYLCGSGRKACCSCGRDCLIRRSCCINAFWNETLHTDLQTYLAFFKEKSEKVKAQSCQDVFPAARTLGHKSETRLMVKLCSLRASNNDIQNCLKPRKQDNNIPVLGSDNLIYANAFCARCNFIDKFVLVNITVECQGVWPPYDEFQQLYRDPTKTINFRENLLGCNFGMARHLGRTCTKDSIRTHCDHTNIYYNLCSLYSGPVGGYKNYHCWKCNKKHISNISESQIPFKYCDDRRCAFGVDCKIQPEPEIRPPPRPHYRWSLLINFSGKASFSMQGLGSKANCQNGTIYDVKSSTCIPFVCPQNYHPDELKCVRDATTPRYFKHLNVTEPNFDNCILAQQVKLYLFLQSNKTSTVNFTDLQLVLNTTNTFEEYHRDNYANIFVMNGTISRDMFQNLIHKISLPWRNVMEIILTSNDVIVTDAYRFDVSRSFQNGRLCAQPKTLYSGVVTFDTLCDARNALSLNASKNTSIPRSEMTLWMTLNPGNVLRYISICKRFHLHSSCPLRVIPSNFTLDNDTGVLTHSLSNYTIEEYVPLKHGVGVCISRPTISYITQPDWLKRLNNIEYYMSISFVSLSIVCYIWIIVTFLVLKELQTIPGLNILSMCVSLLFADCFFLIATQEYKNSKFCKAIAIIIHWAILIAFMWSLIIAIDLVKKFSSFSVSSRERKLKRFIPRCFTAVTIPTIIVGITVVIDESSSLNVGYGLNGVCWIDSLSARLGSYIIPIAVISVLTFTALVYTIYKISFEDRQNKKVLKTNSNKVNTMKIALKLIVILGITECVGFFQIPNPSSDWLKFNATVAFIYSLLRSLRGVMLWLVYIVFGNIFEKYTKLYETSRPRSTTTSGSTPMVTKHTFVSSSSAVNVNSETKM